MNNDWFKEGMDPKSSFLLKIRLFGDPKKVRKEVATCEPTRQPPLNKQLAEPVEDTYLLNPEPNNEHVGVDVEYIYLQKQPAEELPPQHDSDKDYVPESESDVEDGENSELEDEPEIDTYDKEDPPMSVGSTYRNMEEFKLALAQHAVKNKFEYMIEKSEPSRFRAYCARKVEENMLLEDTCLCNRGHVKKNPCAHACCSTRRKKKVRNASKHWIAAKNPNLGAKDLRSKLKEHYKVKIHYKREYMGMEVVRKQIFGDWDASFNNLYRFQAEIEKSSPGSQVTIDHHKIGTKNRFRRMFFALKPCVDGFINGCRPYLAIDNTFLTGRYKGQLATAVAVDGHNWMYLAAFGVFDSETNENLTWFMQKTRNGANKYLRKSAENLASRCPSLL
ncbi:hypothetical protein U9M48_003164 [Paspalum notatum var. saurae]|uniref:SWIM-type domain-containing protein n=1 Tax=Paspalum notatum var. saurae TaxID=547442 RepID=A0AAQ3PS75_PASNO